jgi:16S rRNA (adenine1518-N6/adenine1519-N6)-dimethyltransferase
MGKKQLSQYFFANKVFLERLAEKIAVPDDAVILEIGPGKGAMTGFLLGRSRPLIAVEVDSELVPELREKFVGYTEFTLVNQDIRRFEFPDSLFKVVVVGNVPYHISFEIIEFVVKNRQRVLSAYFMFQKEFARKLCSTPGSKEYGYLSCYAGLYFDVRYLATVPKGHFSPRPRVDSAFIEMRVLPQTRVAVDDSDCFLVFLRRLFTQRRKKILNAVRLAVRADEVPAEVIEQAGVDSDLRPEDLTLQQFADIYRLCQPYVESYS